MASLNTLRTKYGIVLSVVIALVLVAFILGDQLSNQGRGSNMPEDKAVININGEDIMASEYYQYQEMFRDSEIPADGQADLAYEVTLFNNFTSEALEAAGLGVSEEDIKSYARVFANRLTPMYQAYGYPADMIQQQIQQRWIAGLPTIDIVIGQEKFGAAYTAAAYVNRLEVEQALREDNITFDGRYMMVPYAAMPEATVTAEEIDAYYEQNKKANPYFGTRTLRYVSFPIEPTEADRAQVEEVVMAVNNAIAEANGDTDAIKRAVYSIGGRVENYRLVSALDSNVAEAVKAGKNYGPVLEDNTWKASYIISDVTAPATYDFEVVTVANFVEAKELLEALQANGGDFTKLDNAVDVATGSRAMVNMSKADADYFIGTKVGDIFTYTYDNKPAVVKITALGAKDRFVVTADIAKSIVASEITRNNIVKSAEQFIADAGDNIEAFNSAADAAQYQILETTVNRNDYTSMQGMARGVRNIPGSRELAIWAYDAQVGDKKSTHGQNVIYVAMVSAVNDEEFEAKNAFVIENTLKRDKQYEAIAAQMTMGAEIEGAEMGTFSGVKFSDNNVDNRYESALVGAITMCRETGVETRVKGRTGAYVFVVEAINGTIDPATLETERTPEMTQRETAMSSVAVEALNSKATVKDFRGAGEI